MLSVTVPASKSMSHRLLMGAALAHGKSTIHNVLMSKDIECTTAVLSGAGAKFEYVGNTAYVQGMGAKPTAPATGLPLSCYMHESGTSCRLLTAILAVGQGSFRIHGAPRLHERPMGALTSALQDLGVKIDYEKQENYLPLIINTNGFKNNEAYINIDESSQYLSGLLLAAPCTSTGLNINLLGTKPVSWPYVALTLKTLEQYGIKVTVQEKISKNENNSGNEVDAWQDIVWQDLQEIIPGEIRLCVPSAPYISGEYTVEGDWSNASYFLAAGAIGKQPLRIKGLRQDSLQGDKAMLEILSAMQAKYAWDGDDIVVSPSNLKGIDVDMKQCPDLVPTVAVLAAFANGATTISNVQHLRIKECDRIAAPAAELAKVGVKVDIFDDGLCIHGLGKTPVVPKGTIFSSHNDHRIAMSCALLGLHSEKISLDDASVVQKSFPHFWQLWESIN